MSTQNVVERELRSVLDRHAEDAMGSTDTWAELNRFSEVLETEPRTDRRHWAVAVAAAAAVVTAVAVLSTLPGDDGTAPPPTNNKSTEELEREAELLADRVVAAYADHDGAAVASYLSSGESAWPGLMRSTDRDRAWRVEYLLRPCEAETNNSVGIVVECPTVVHLMHSEEIGAGPFRGSKFSMLITNGVADFGDVTYPFETNGMSEHVDAFWAWLVENHREDTTFLDQDEGEVPAAQWDRWVRLYEKRVGEYGEAMTREGNG